MPELNEKIKSLFPDRRIVAFYIRDCRVIPDEWMVALGQELRSLGFAVIGLLSGEAADRMNLDGLDQVFQVEAEAVQRLGAISCFIVTDLEQIAYPLTSRVLAFSHAISCISDPKAYPLAAYTTGMFDGFCVGFPFGQRQREIKELWGNFSPPEKNIRSSSQFYLMGYGYAKLDLGQSKCMRYQREKTPHCLCYAPTLLNIMPHLGGQRIGLHGERIIRTLLSNFPDHDIIFRPAPHDINDPLIQKIVTTFSDEPRFRLDTSTSYLDTFAAAQVMVTDIAHIGSTFLLTTLRPSVYFQPWITTGTRRISSLAWRTNSYSDLVATVREALNMTPPRDSAALYKEYGLLPTENAIETLALAIPDFIDARPHEDWLVISREKNHPGISSSQMIQAIREDWEGMQVYNSQFYAKYFSRRPLAVFALHLLRQRTPDAPIPDDLAELAGLAPAEGERRYGDIGTEELVRLYMAAAEDEKARSRQPEQIKMQDVTTLYELARLVVEDTPL